MQYGENGDPRGNPASRTTEKEEDEEEDEEEECRQGNLSGTGAQRGKSLFLLIEAGAIERSEEYHVIPKK